MATILSLLLVVVHLLYILIVDTCSMAIVCSLLLVVVHLLYISIVNIYSMATVSTCSYNLLILKVIVNFAIQIVGT